MTLERNEDGRSDEAAANDADLTVDEAGDEATDLSDEEVEVAAIRSDIEETRVEMGGTLKQLGDRLEPGHLVDEAKQNVRDATIGRVEETAKGMTDMVMDTIKKNPVPAALAGAGLALLWMNRSNGAPGDGRRSQYGYGPTYATGAGYGTSDGGRGRGITDRAGDAASGIGDTVGDAVGEVGQRVGAMGASVGETVGHGVQETSWRLERFMQSSPIAVGAIALGTGALVGALVPETPPEREMLGDASRAVGETVRDAVGQAADRAEETLDETARAQGDGAGG